MKTKKPRSRRRNFHCGDVYHIYQRGNYRQDVFFTATHLLIYLRRIALLADRYHIRLHAFCLMSNHIHFLVETSRKDGISRFMQQLQAYHARLIHSDQNQDGHLWKNRFGHTRITSPAHYRHTMLYIERNPLQAKMVTRAEYYPYSSAAAHVANSPLAVIGHGQSQVQIPLFLDRWQLECEPATWRQALMDHQLPDILQAIQLILRRDRLTPLLPNSLPPPSSVAHA